MPVMLETCAIGTQEKLSKQKTDVKLENNLPRDLLLGADQTHAQGIGWHWF